MSEYDETSQQQTQGLSPRQAPGDASWRPDTSVGRIFNLPASAPNGTQAPEMLRLDAGLWDIKVVRLVTGQLGLPTPAAAPSQISPTFPLILLKTVGQGVAMWQEALPLIARGSHFIHCGETCEVNVRCIAALGAAAEQVLVVARRVMNATQPPTYLVSETKVVAAGASAVFDVPIGALRMTIYTSNVVLNGTWRDAAAAGLVTAAGVNVKQVNINNAPLPVPTTAKDFQTANIPAGATLTVVWECEY